MKIFTFYRFEYVLQDSTKIMNFKNKFICIIPARGGSKGLKNKNLLKINKKPLIFWPIDAAKKVKNIKNNFNIDSKIF